MARIAEGVIASFGSVLGGFNLHFAQGANVSYERALGVVNNLRLDSLADSATRITKPGSLQVAEFHLAGQTNTRVATTLAGTGLILSLLSVIGHSRGKFWISPFDQGSTAAFITEGISTAALVMAPQLLYSLVNQLQYLQIATQLGFAEKIGLGIEIGLFAFALPKVPSILEGIRYVTTDAIIPVARTVLRKTGHFIRPRMAKVLEERRSQKQAGSDHYSKIRKAQEAERQSRISRRIFAGIAKHGPESSK